MPASKDKDTKKPAKDDVAEQPAHDEQPPSGPNEHGDFASASPADTHIARADVVRWIDDILGDRSFTDATGRHHLAELSKRVTARHPDPDADHGKEFMFDAQGRPMSDQESKQGD